MIKYLFYVFAVLSVYSYFLYPIILRFIPIRRKQYGNDGDSIPFVSLIITVHNEENRIRDKINNTLEIKYPHEYLQVIVASDYSTDDTDNIVKTFCKDGINLVRADQRKGKEYAQFCAIREAKGDILVFSDVATMIPPNAIKLLTKEFIDTRVGALSSEDRFVSNDGSIVGEGAYVKYEMWLRRLESNRAGLIGLSGSFFAARRQVCEDWDIYSPSDFNTALNCAKKGLVAVSCPDVVGIYKDVKDPGLEYRRKMRTVIRGITAIVRHPEVLSPFRMGLFAFQVWSHKIMRWGVPWFLLLFLIFTILLLGEGMIYTSILIAQLIFYTLALGGWLSSKFRRNTLVRIVFFFVQTNLALAQATISFLFGKRMTVWTPSKR